jgi:hypothetical protein
LDELNLINRELEMNRVIILSNLSGDKERIIELYSERLNKKDIFCSSHEELDRLLKSDEIYFVFSRDSILSSQYQSLVYSSLPIISILPSLKEKNVECFLIFLDQVEIPKGFDFSATPLGIDITSLPTKSL